MNNNEYKELSSNSQIYNIVFSENKSDNDERKQYLKF